MSRLTKKLKPPYERVAGEDYVYTSETRLTPSFAKVEQKLGQLEDIEEKYCIDSNEDLKRRLDLADKYGELGEQLGISLDILFKALKNGIYKKENGKVRFIPPDDLVFDNEYLYELKYCKGYTKLKENTYPYSFVDYGKTWALTEEELL